MTPRRIDGEGLTLAIVLLIALTLFVMPLAQLARAGLTADGVVTLQPILDALDSRSVPRALVNSLDSAFFSATIALVLGLVIALVIGLTDVRGKGVFTFLLLIPMMVPPHVTAIAWIQAMGPSSPLLQLLGLAPPPGSTHPLYSREGVIVLLSIQHMPLVFLVVLAALRALPREMIEAARIAGARPLAVLRRVVLPLLAPILISAFALAFVSALGNFGIPALLGIPARYTTLPVLLWQRLASFGPDVLSSVAAIAALLAAIAIAVIALQMAILSRTRSALIGPPQPPLAIRLGRRRPLVEMLLGLVVLATLVLPVIALVTTSLIPTYGVPFTLQTITLENFAEVLFRQQVTVRAFANSTLVAGLAGLVLAALAMAVGHFLNARGRLYRRAGTGLAALAETTYAIPGLVISIAFILAFIRPIPILDVSIYNTLAIIGLAYVCAFLSIALKPVAAATAQLDPALEEAARVAGARFFMRIGRIFAPLIAPAAASGAILVFLTAYNEITVSALLWSTGNETIGTTIYNYEDGGYTTLAAAMSTVTVIATIALMVALDRFGRRLPPGVVPWRM